MDGAWEAWWGWKSSHLAAPSVAPVPKATLSASTAVSVRPKANDFPKAHATVEPRSHAFPALSYRREPPGQENPMGTRAQDLPNATSPQRSSSNIGRSIGVVKQRRLNELGTWTPGGKHTGKLSEAPRRNGLRPGSRRPEWIATSRVTRMRTVCFGVPHGAPWFLPHEASEWCSCVPECSRVRSVSYSTFT